MEAEDSTSSKAIMLWQVAADALPLGGKVGRWVANQNAKAWLCPMYGREEEFAKHLFLACLGSKFVWRNGPWTVNTESFIDLHL